MYLYDHFTHNFMFDYYTLLFLLLFLRYYCYCTTYFDIDGLINNVHISQFSYLSDVDIVPCDISVAGRVLAAFPEFLDEKQRVPDNLAHLGKLALQPDCSIVKLPNISAPINQLQDCIAELRAKGYNVPLYPTEPQTDEERDIQSRYQKIAGSAVNPVLREGNSDRRVAAPVKAYAQKNPHPMGLWSKASRTHVAHMSSGDFFESEQSVIMEKDTSVEIVLVDGSSGTETTLKEEEPLLAKEVIDSFRFHYTHSMDAYYKVPKKINLEYYFFSF